MSTQKFPNELFFCQAQGPTQGQGQGHGKVKVMVRSWSGHGQDMVRSGQVRANSDSNSNSKVGPELYTKIGFHPPSTTTTHHTISK